MTDSRLTPRSLIVLVVLLVFLPALWTEAMIDDLYILRKCAKLPFLELLSEGFHFRTSDFGHVWWISTDTMAHYFRPLLLLSFRLPMLLPLPVDLIQHAINIALHLAVCLALLALSRKLGMGKRAVLISTIFVAVNPHAIVPVHWMVARKETLVALALIGLLWFHGKRRRPLALLCLGCALASGEQAIVFPLIVLVFDLLITNNEGQHWRQVAKERWRDWFALIDVTIGYLIIRYLVLGPPVIPTAPYCTAPWTANYLAKALGRLALAATSLCTGLPYIEHCIWLGLDFAALALLVLAFSGCVLWSIWHLVPTRRVRAGLFLSIAIAWSPFSIMIAAPFYLYTPLVLFSIALGFAVQGIPSNANSSKGRMGRLILLVAFFVSALGAFAASYAGWAPTPREVSFASKMGEPVSQIVSKLSSKTKVIFVDLPILALHIVPYVHDATGHPVANFLLLASRNDFLNAPAARLTVHSPHRFALESPDRPFFATQSDRLMNFMRDETLDEQSTFYGPWYRVTIEREGKRGIASMNLIIDDSEAPVVIISFAGGHPSILYEDR